MSRHSLYIRKHLLQAGQVVIGSPEYSHLRREQKLPSDVPAALTRVTRQGGPKAMKQEKFNRLVARFSKGRR